MSKSPSKEGALMEPDAMSVRLHLRRIRVIAVVVDLVEKLVVEVHSSGGSLFVVRVQDDLDPRLPPSPGSGSSGSWTPYDSGVGSSSLLVWRVLGAVVGGPSRDPGWAPYACDPATGPPAGAGRQRHVDPGSGSPPRPSVALHHGPHPGLVGPGRRRAPPAPLPGPVDRRDQPPPRPPVCDGADQRRHRPNAGDRGTSQPSRPLRVPPGPRTPVAQRRQGGGVGWFRLLPLRHRPASRPCHPRPGSVPRRSLVRGGDDRGAAPYPTHRPPRITPGIQTGHLPVQVSAAHPPRPPV